MTSGDDRFTVVCRGCDSTRVLGQSRVLVELTIDDPAIGRCDLCLWFCDAECWQVWIGQDAVHEALDAMERPRRPAAS